MAVGARIMHDDVVEIYERICALSPREQAKLRRYMGLINPNVLSRYLLVLPEDDLDLNNKDLDAYYGRLWEEGAPGAKAR